MELEPLVTTKFVAKLCHIFIYLSINLVTNLVTLTFNMFLYIISQSPHG